MERWSPDEKTGGAVPSMIARMTEESGELFEPGASRKSDFFRDLAASRYLE